jgi:hypothetical protein
MRFRYSVIVLLALAFVVSGCVRTLPVYNVTDAPVITASGAQPNLAAVRNAITTAAQDKGWVVRDIDDEHIEATVHVRKHTAVVDILYSPSQYRIMYKSSDALLYDGTQIHRNYNKWVELLEQRINIELNKL